MEDFMTSGVYAIIATALTAVLGVIVPFLSSKLAKVSIKVKELAKIVDRLHDKTIEAYADGKITGEELEALVKEFSEAIPEIKSILEM